MKGCPPSKAFAGRIPKQAWKEKKETDETGIKIAD